jgi:hypothetical protein
MPRPGHTLAETLVALGLGAAVIGLGATIGFRHQRFHRDLVIAVERAEQLEQVAALMPISLRSIAPGEGDIAPGAARDTALEFRATIATGVVCDTGHSSVVLAPAGESPRLTSILSRPEPGDTAWSLTLLDTRESWIPHRILGVSDSLVACALGGSFPFGSAQRRALALQISPTPAPSTPLRITRPWRYSLYRASDGLWYLGAKDWNPALSRFNTIQPVGGPFASAAAGGLRFSYADSVGSALPAGTANTRDIALIEVAFRVDSALPGTYRHAVAVHNRSQSAIGLRNRAR